MRRGQLWTRGGTEHYLIVSTDALNNTLGTVWGLLATDQDPGLDPPLAIPADAGPNNPQLWVLATQIRTIDTAALTSPIGSADPDTMADIDAALLRIAGLRNTAPTRP